MFGYTVPLYQRLTAKNLADYQRYYCETCHQLKAQFGLVSAAAVNYDMCFNTIVLNSVMGGDDSFDRTPKSWRCVFRKPYTDQEVFRRMAAYTILLTKWELYDDEVDKPSMKTKFIDLALSRAISKAESEYPEYDRIVGEGFGRLRDLEAEGCTDPVLMGTTFGKALTEPLSDIAGEADSPALRALYTSLTTAVYVMDAVDDLEPMATLDRWGAKHLHAKEAITHGIASRERRDDLDQCVLVFAEVKASVDGNLCRVGSARRCGKHEHDLQPDLFSPVEGEVDKVNAALVGTTLWPPRAKHIPGDGKPYGVESPGSDAREVRLFEELLTMLFDEGAIAFASQCRYEGGFVKRSGVGKELGRDPRLKRKPARQVDTMQRSLGHARIPPQYDCP